MRRINIAFLVISLTMLIACRLGNQVKKDNLVSVSILPQKYFVEYIADDDFQVNVMIPPGASPATYEPTPVQMKEIAQSVAYFRIGHIPFETVWLHNLVKAAGEIKVIDLSNSIELIRGRKIRHGDHYHEGGIDPHIWSSPKSAKIIANNLYKELGKLKPANQAKYKENLNRLLAEIDDLDKLATEAFSGDKQIAFMIYHPALSYLARDYGLKQISIETDGKEPSPAHMQHLVGKAREYGIKIVFIQKQFNRENAAAIAKEIGAKVVQIDPLNEDWQSEMKRIVQFLKGDM